MVDGPAKERSECFVTWFHEMTKAGTKLAAFDGMAEAKANWLGEGGISSPRTGRLTWSRARSGLPPDKSQTQIRCRG